MKTYSDLRDIDTTLIIHMELEPQGSVQCQFGVDDILWNFI